MTVPLYFVIFLYHLSLIIYFFVSVIEILWNNCMRSEYKSGSKKLNIIFAFLFSSPFFTGPLKNFNARNTVLLQVDDSDQMWAPFLCWEIILDSHWAAIERSSLLHVSCKQACTPACHSSAPVPCIRSVQDLAFVDLQQEIKYKILQFDSGEIHVLFFWFMILCSLVGEYQHSHVHTLPTFSIV